MATLRERLKSQKGASAVELALYAPVLFLVVFLIVQAALVWHGHQIASSVAREVARKARVDTATAPFTATETWGLEYAQQIAGNGLHNIDVDVELVPNTQDVRVVVTGTSLEIVDGVSPAVKQTVRGPRERFDPDL